MPLVCLQVKEELSQNTVVKVLPLNEALLGKSSPLQQRILIELAAGPSTLGNLSSKTGSSVYTVGKQLSLLQLRAKYNPLHGKGITRPLVKKNKDSGVKTTYFLNPGQ